jgi:hypothetical protein
MPAQFLAFNKLIVGSSALTTPIIVNRSAILLAEQETLEDKTLGITYDTTRIHLIGYPEYSFHVLVGLDAVLDVVHSVDTTANEVVTVDNLDGTLPMLKLFCITNNDASLTRTIVCNPNYIIHAEEVSFQDVKTQAQGTYTSIVMRGNPIRRLSAQMPLTQLAQVLEPVHIAP